MNIKKYTIDNYQGTILTKNILLFGKIIPNREAFKIGRQMKEVMLKNGGVGLAANQVDVPSPIIIVGTRAFYRPEFLSESQQKIVDWEECLSLPGIRRKIARPWWVKFSAIIDERGKRKTYVYEGALARVWMHEFHHLCGLTILDVPEFKGPNRIDKETD